MRLSSVIVGLLLLGSVESFGSSTEAAKASTDANKTKKVATSLGSYRDIINMENPAKEVQLAAIEKSYYAIKLIKNPDIEAIKLYSAKLHQEN